MLQVLFEGLWFWYIRIITRALMLAIIWLCWSLSSNCDCLCMPSFQYMLICICNRSPKQKWLCDFKSNTFLLPMIQLIWTRPVNYWICAMGNDSALSVKTLVDAVLLEWIVYIYCEFQISFRSGSHIVTVWWSMSVCDNDNCSEMAVGLWTRFRCLLFLNYTILNFILKIYSCFSLHMRTITLIGQVSGPRLNIKTVFSTYGDFHVKDKTAVRTSYL